MATCTGTCECGESCSRQEAQGTHVHSCKKPGCPFSGKLGHEAAGLTEELFLARYKAKDYPRPSVTVDLVIFTVVDSDLKVLLIERKGHPYRGRWAIPGGFVDVAGGPTGQGESLPMAAARELEEETGLVSVFLEQLYTFGSPGRDPRDRVISVAHYALLPASRASEVQPGSDAKEARWFSVSELPLLAFDHAEILYVAIERIRGKIDYTNIAFELVPETFTVKELRAVYEAVKGNTYDTANFRRRFKRMQTDGIIEQAPGKRQTSTKPAKVFRFSRSTGRRGSQRRTSAD